MNFEEIGKKVKKISQDTLAEVQKMNEVRQLNGKISDEKKLLNQLYLEMGQKLYDSYKESPLEGFADDFRQIEERFTTIDLLQDQVRTVKGVVLCPCCNMEVNEEDRFCTNCGNRMPEVVKIEHQSEDDANTITVDSTVVEPETEAPADEAEPAESEAVEAEQTEAEPEAPADEAEAVESEVVEAEPTEAAPADEAEPEEPEAAGAEVVEAESTEAEKTVTE